MPPRALIVAVERPLDPHFPGVPHAVAAGRALAEAMGDPAPLLGDGATAARVAVRLRRFVADPDLGATVIVVIAPTFVEDGLTRVALHDTLSDAPEATAPVLADLCDAADLLLLDSPESPFDLSGVRAAVLSACGPGQPSGAAESPARRLWATLVADALTGRTPGALEADGRLTAASLARHVAAELPRALRKFLADPDRQKPLARGELGVTLARFAPPAAPGASLLDASQVERLAFRHETSGRVKALGGFLKTHQVPDRVTSATQQFIGRLARTDIQADIDEIFAALRDHFGFARKDLESGVEADGTGFIRTPKFDYTVTARIDPDDPASVLWRREVARLRDPEVVRDAPFRAAFGNTFDTLVFEVLDPIDVPAFVDRIEESKPAGVKVALSPDQQRCTLTVPGLGGSIGVEPMSVTVSGRSPAGPGSLLDAFLQFQRRFGGAAAPRALPGGAEGEVFDE